MEKPTEFLEDSGHYGPLKVTRPMNDGGEMTN
jgi:hypothetical protein